MHFITYLNRTEAETNDTWFLYQKALVLEICIIVISMIYFIGVIYINEASHQYHLNMRRIFSFYCGQYMVQKIVRITQITIILTSKPNADGQYLFDTTSFYITTSYIRASCLFMAICILPAFITERACATYYLHDYETRERSHIQFIIITILISGGITAAITFHAAETTLYHIALFLLLNLFATIGNMVNDRLNIQYYYESQSRSGQFREYSLAERYQISENIKTAKVWTRVVLSIMAFNTICTVALVVDNLNVPVEYRSVAGVAFNYSILSYGFVVPIVCYINNDMWQAELKRILRGSRTSPLDGANARITPLRDSFGSEMNIQTDKQAERYFDMLHKDWS